MTPRPPREWPRSPENANEWDTEENSEDRAGREPAGIILDVLVDAVGAPTDHEPLNRSRMSSGQTTTPESTRSGGDTDLRIDSRINAPALSLTHYSDPEYNCQVHGTVSEVINFTLDGEEETYCIRCWRDWFRDNGMVQVNRINTQEYHEEEHETLGETSSHVQSDGE